LVSSLTRKFLDTFIDGKGKASRCPCNATISGYQYLFTHEKKGQALYSENGKIIRGDSWIKIYTEHVLLTESSLIRL
jgi:hypothetical protein